MKAKFYLFYLALYGSALLSQPLTTSTISPLRKGGILTNMGLNFSYTNQNRSDTSAFKNPVKSNGASYALNFNSGYFVASNVVIGVFGSIGVNGNTSKTDANVNGVVTSTTIKSNGNNYSGGLFARTYQKLRNEKFAVFLQTNLGYTWSTSGYTVSSSSSSGSDSKSKTNTSSYSIGVNPGLTYFINHRVAVEGVILGSLSAQ